MILLGHIEHLLIDHDGTCRLIFGANDKGYEVFMTRAQHDELMQISGLELVVFHIEPITRTLISAEKYVEEPVQKVEDEPLTDEKPFRCQWCRKACDGRTDGLCDECQRDNIAETALGEKLFRAQSEQVIRQEEIKRGIV